MTAATEEISPRLEDALAYLPRKAAVEYARGQIIYNEHHPSHELSLVTCGRVRVTMVTDGTPTVIGIFSADEFFGFASLLGDYTKASEEAIALERTQLMPWSRAEIEAAIERQPRLGVALMQIAAQLCLDFEERLQGLALSTTSERLAVSLLRFAHDAQESDGAVSIPPLTHQLLSEYIGTSRETITAHMNEWRRQGFVRYSRNAIYLYPEALSEHLRGRRT